MKKILFVIAMLFSAAYGQDYIVLINGEEIVAKVKEINISDVKYTKFDNLTGPIYTINKSDVFLIKYENGTKDVLKVVEAAPVVQPRATVLPTATPSSSKAAASAPVVISTKKGCKFTWNWLAEKPVITSCVIQAVNDGRERNGRIYEHTGHEFQIQLRDKLLSKGVSCELNAGNAPYIVKAEIFEFEDLPGEWTLNRDRLDISIEISDAATGTLVGVGSFKVAKRGNLFRPQTPAVLFPLVVDEFVKTIL